MKCTLCGRDFEYRRLDRATKEICGSCMANRHRFALKAACVKYKGGACQLCGYNRCMRALTFHHLDPDKKGFGFGGKPRLKGSNHVVLSAVSCFGKC